MMFVTDNNNTLIKGHNTKDKQGKDKKKRTKIRHKYGRVTVCSRQLHCQPQLKLAIN
jgi:hypothetical protein